MSTSSNVKMILTRKDGMSARQALAALPVATALIYTPTQCCFGLTENGKLTGNNDQEIDPDTAYEIRLFNNDAELRWRRDGKSGNAVICSEQEQQNLADGFEQIQNIDTTAQENKYLLWGEYESRPDDGWPIFSDARIGKLPIPISAKKQTSCKLIAQEYFAESEDGNMVFAGERLIGIEVCEISEEKK